MRSSGPSPITWYAIETSPLIAYRVSGTGDCIQPPFARHALQLRDPTLVELDARAGHEVLDRLRDEHLSRLRLRRDPRSDRDRDPRDLSVQQLAFACVQSGADFESELSHLLGDRARAPDRAGRPVERGEEPVARRVDLLAAETRELAAGELMVLGEQLAPASVTE